MMFPELDDLRKGLLLPRLLFNLARQPGGLLLDVDRLNNVHNIEDIRRCCVTPR